MQSGIVASADLQSAFKKFTSDTSLFALPITITSESLKPLDAIPLKTDFKSSLPLLSQHLQPKVPIYLILRRPSPSAQTGDLIAITYVPSIAPVRSKTLFASTRSSLIRDLGLEKFSDTLFVTDAEEVLEPSQWAERAAADERSRNGPDTTLLSTEERELQSVKRAEEEERHGTSGRDLMGESGSGGSRGVTGTNASGIRMKISDEAKQGLAKLKESSSTTDGGVLVQFGIEMATETLVLLSSANSVTAREVSRKIPDSRPSYTFYHYPGTESVVFIYTCPGSSKVKERMVYAASKNGIVEMAKNEGVRVVKRLEAGDADDISEERLKEEVGVSEGAADSQASSSRQGFARPKRPGKR